MVFGVLGLIMLAVLGIAALCHERTRPLGYILLFVPVALLAVGAFRMFGFAALGGATRASKVMLGMPVVMLLVVGGIAALVALLSNRRTRPIGYTLLAVPVVLGGLFVAGFFIKLHNDFGGFPSIVKTSPVVRETLPVAKGVTAGSSSSARKSLSENTAGAASSGTQQPPADKTSSSGRPAWVGAPGQRVGDAYQIVFIVGPYTTRLECDQAMDEQLNQAVAEYAALYLGDDKARRATLPVSFLRGHVLKDQWEEVYQSSVGEMVRVHTWLLFDGRTNAELKASLRRATIEERLWIAGGGLAAILMTLAFCFGVLKSALKIDNTNGTHRRWMLAALVFATVFTGATVTGVAVTWLSKSTRPTAMQIAAENRTTPTITMVEQIGMPDASTPVSHAPERATEIHEQGMNANPITFRKDTAFFALIAAPLLCLIVGLLIFKKTRVVGCILILVSSGVVALMALAVVTWSDSF